MGRWLERLRAEEENDALRVEARADGATALIPPRCEPGGAVPEAPRRMALADWSGCDVPPPSAVSGPGVRVVPPAIEIPAAEYDHHLDTLIAAVGTGSAEAAKLTYTKRKGWVVPRGNGRVFTRGRW